MLVTCRVCFAQGIVVFDALWPPIPNHNLNYNWVHAQYITTNSLYSFSSLIFRNRNQKTKKVKRRVKKVKARKLRRITVTRKRKKSKMINLVNRKMNRTTRTQKKIGKKENKTTKRTLKMRNWRVKVKRTELKRRMKVKRIRPKRRVKRSPHLNQSLSVNLFRLNLRLSIYKKCLLIDLMSLWTGKTLLKNCHEGE